MQEILSKKKIGVRVKNLRLDNKFSQAYVSQKLKISRSNYSQIELGNQYPTFTTLNALSKHYNKSYEWLLHGREDDKKDKQKNLPYVNILSDLEVTLKNFSNSLKKLENELQLIKTKIAVS